MSIEKRVVPFSAFFAGARAIDIKDLKDLREQETFFFGARTLARETRSHACVETSTRSGAGAPELQSQRARCL